MTPFFALVNLPENSLHVHSRRSVRRRVISRTVVAPCRVHKSARRVRRHPRFSTTGEAAAAGREACRTESSTDSAERPERNILVPAIVLLAGRSTRTLASLGRIPPRSATGSDVPFPLGHVRFIYDIRYMCVCVCVRVLVFE